MSESLVRNAWLVPFFPLLGALTAAVGGRWLRQRAHWPVIVGIGLSCLVALGLLGAAGPDKTTVVYDWFEISRLHVPIEFRVDGLTTMMLAMVTFVSTLVAIFAAGYMAGEPGYPRFFAVVGLFVTSMTGLVLSNNYLLTYVFWEGVGTCSYLLVGFWYFKPSAAAAAKKAFLVNRVGDFGFATAIFWMWSIVPNHDLSYNNVLGEHLATLHAQHPEAILGIALLLFWAATAKSAQVPLYVWLPDAMEGPTPVSALIHAATMVTAGVYLIARSTPLIALVPSVQLLIAITGCVTALLAATIALTQTDLKRVLAYSTVSQLGYMFMALGAGVGDVAQLAVVAGMFHLFTARLLQGLAVPRLGERDARDGGRHRHAPLRRLAAQDAVHLLDVRRRRPGPRRHPPPGGLLQQGRDPHGLEGGVARLARAGLVGGLHGGLLGRRPDRVHDGVLHLPRLLPDLLRPREAPQPRRPRGPGGGGRRRRRPFPREPR